MPVAASYFDGRTSRRHAVELEIADGVARIRGEAHGEFALAEVEVSERSVHAMRKLALPGGAYVEVGDAPALDAMLRAAGHEDGMAVRMQQSWRHALIALASAIGLCVIGYVYALPFAADRIARGLPQSVERSLGHGVLEFLDGRVFDATRLTPQRQQAISGAFARLATPDRDATACRIVFRASRIGPNAFALPSGDIVLTDEMVKLVGDDGALMAVLAHELGHLHERHLTRRLIQASVVGGVSTLLFSDTSAIVANLPTLLLDLRYSRDAETAADDYAVAMLKANGVPPALLADDFEKMRGLGEANLHYLSTHPATTERIARIRAQTRSQ